MPARQSHITTVQLESNLIFVEIIEGLINMFSFFLVLSPEDTIKKTFLLNMYRLARHSLLTP